MCVQSCGIIAVLKQNFTARTELNHIPLVSPSSAWQHKYCVINLKAEFSYYIIINSLLHFHTRITFSGITIFTHYVPGDSDPWGWNWFTSRLAHRFGFYELKSINWYCLTTMKVYKVILCWKLYMFNYKYKLQTFVLPPESND